MLICFTLFVLVKNMTTAFMANVFANQSAVYSILVIVMFLAIALTILHQTRRWGWVGFLIAAILYAAVEILAPYQNSVAIVIAAIVAIVIAVIVKRPMWRYARRLKGWKRVVFTLI